MMKVLATILTYILMFIGVFLSSNKNITVTTTSLINDKGKVSFVLFDKVTFMKRPLKLKRALIIDGKSKVTFENLKKGEYSIVCFHDKNNNDRIDFDESGVPIEEFASTKHRLIFGINTFENSKFSLGDENLNLEINFQNI
jgi:uncharacterized protein (DUF2141 family)